MEIVPIKFMVIAADKSNCPLDSKEKLMLSTRDNDSVVRCNFCLYWKGLEIIAGRIIGSKCDFVRNNSEEKKCKKNKNLT